MDIMMTKAVATIIHATSPLFGTGAGAGAADATATGATAVAVAADAAVSAGLTSAEADVAGAAEGVCAIAAVPPTKRLKPRARVIKRFFIEPPYRSRQCECGRLARRQKQISCRRRSCRCARRLQ